MKKKYLVCVLLFIVAIVLIVNFLALINGLYGTDKGRYVSIFNIAALGIEVPLYLYLNKPFSKKQSS